MLGFSLVLSRRISTRWGGGRMARQHHIIDVDPARDRKPRSMYPNVTSPNVKCHFFAGAFPSSHCQSNPIKAIGKPLWRNGNEVFAHMKPYAGDETKPTRRLERSYFKRSVDPWPLAASRIRGLGNASTFVREATSGEQHRRYVCFESGFVARRPRKRVAPREAPHG